MQKLHSSQHHPLRNNSQSRMLEMLHSSYIHIHANENGFHERICFLLEHEKRNGHHGLEKMQ